VVHGRHRPADPVMYVPLREHLAELQVLRDKFAAERDRRYTETGLEREKALKIKEQADRDALALARADQTYKDERANNLRTQLERERGDYATKADIAALSDKINAAIAPLQQYMATTQGRAGGLSSGWGLLVAAVGLVAAVIAIVSRL